MPPSLRPATPVDEPLYGRRLSPGSALEPLGPLVALVDGRGALTHLSFLGDRPYPEHARRLAAPSPVVLLEEVEPADEPPDEPPAPLAPPAQVPQQVHQGLAAVTAALERYISSHGGPGETGDRAGLAFAPRGSDFQRRVWTALLEIPRGTTTSYGELARRLGRPGGARAVGRANATNPIAVLVPCHRVVGADGTLTGYAGGLARKEWLLELEGWQGAPGGAQGSLFS